MNNIQISKFFQSTKQYKNIDTFVESKPAKPIAAIISLSSSLIPSNWASEIEIVIETK